jgi:hypothetical protein
MKEIRRNWAAQASVFARPSGSQISLASELEGRYQ